MKTRIISLATSGLLAAVTASAQNNVVWFDTPTSLNGRSIWYGGHPEKFTNGIKPINAGDRNYNPDREWEERSLPLGNGSIGANILGSIATERITLNEKTLWRGGPGTGKAGQKGTPAGAANYWNMNKQSAHLIPEIRQAFADGDNDKASRGITSTAPCLIKPPVRKNSASAHSPRWASSASKPASTKRA